MIHCGIQMALLHAQECSFRSEIIMENQNWNNGVPNAAVISMMSCRVGKIQCMLTEKHRTDNLSMPTIWCFVLPTMHTINVRYHSRLLTKLNDVCVMFSTL